VTVLSIYSQGGGKVATHSWQSDTRSIGAVSYLVMQLYEYAHHRTFRAVHQRNATLQVFVFAHLPADHYLRLLPGKPQLAPDGRTLNIDEDAIRVFTELRAKERQVLLAVQALRAARKRARKQTRARGADIVGDGSGSDED
jgi:hypothetical protein